MAVKNRAKKSYSYRKYFKRDGYYIIEKIVVIFSLKNFQIFNSIVK